MPSVWHTAHHTTSEWPRSMAYVIRMLLCYTFSDSVCWQTKIAIFWHTFGRPPVHPYSAPRTTHVRVAAPASFLNEVVFVHNATTKVVRHCVGVWLGVVRGVSRVTNKEVSPRHTNTSDTGLNRNGRLAIANSHDGDQTTTIVVCRESGKQAFRPATSSHLASPLRPDHSRCGLVDRNPFKVLTS